MLVAIDQEATEKNEKSMDDPHVRLSDVLKAIQKKTFEQYKRATIAGLQSQTHDEQDQLDILKNLIDRKETGTA